MKRVLLFACDPGGANVIAPIIEPLCHAGYTCTLFGKDAALKKFAENNLHALDIKEYCAQTSEETIENFIKQQNPHVVITGTSANDFTEKYLWKVCQKLDIPSFAILDQWMNYGIRFSKYPLSRIQDHNNSQDYSYMPAKIFVMDEQAKIEMIDEGIDKHRIMVAGHPYLESVAQKKELFSTIQKSYKQQDNQDNNEIVISFFSEPLLQSFGYDYWGYTEQTILQNLMHALINIAHVPTKKIKVIVKPHPREDQETLKNFIESMQSSLVTCSIIDKPLWDIFLMSDLVCGISSMVLIEAALLGKPIMSIQIGLTRKNPFILDRRSIVRSIYDVTSLAKALELMIVHEVNPSSNFELATDSATVIVNKIRSVVC